MRSDNKSVLVTGGTKGIGLGIAKVFARRGAKVMLVGRTEEEGCKAVAAVRAQTPEAVVEFVPGDVVNLAHMERVAQAAVQRFGGMDVLCANAGIFPSAKLEVMTEADWDTVVDVNLKGMFFSVKACMPYLKMSGAGRVVLTSSITGPITGFPGWAHYGATKAGMLGFMRTAAIELAPHGVTINAVMPGNILTEGLLGMGQQYLDRMAASIPLRRLGSVEDIGHAALFFASKEAGYITGQTLVVDGGQILPESLDALSA